MNMVAFDNRKIQCVKQICFDRSHLPRIIQDSDNDLVGQKLTVPSIIRTMLEIIKIKKIQVLDEQSRISFTKFAKEITLMAEKIK